MGTDNRTSVVLAQWLMPFANAVGILIAAAVLLFFLPVVFAMAAGSWLLEVVSDKGEDR